MNAIKNRTGIKNLNKDDIVLLDDVSGGFGLMDVAPYILGAAQTLGTAYFAYYAIQNADNRDRHRRYCREIVENVIESSFENMILAWRAPTNLATIPPWIRTLWQNAQNNVNNGATTPAGVCNNV